MNVNIEVMEKRACDFEMKRSLTNTIIIIQILLVNCKMDHLWKVNILRILTSFQMSLVEVKMIYLTTKKENVGLNL